MAAGEEKGPGTGEEIEVPLDDLVELLVVDSREITFGKGAVRLSSSKMKVTLYNNGSIYIGNVEVYRSTPAQMKEDFPTVLEALRSGRYTLSFTKYLRPVLDIRLR